MPDKYSSVERELDEVLKGLTALNNFIVRAEKEIYDVEDVDAYDTDTLISLYRSASDRQIKILELARKILSAPRAKGEPIDEELLSVAQMLSNMRKVDLERIKEIIKGSLH